MKNVINRALAAEKKLFILLAAVMMTAGVMGQANGPVADIKGDLNAYSYYYVVPANAVTSSSGHSVAIGYGSLASAYGNQTSTVSPSETISGYLMKSGFNVLDHVIDELADKTLVVSYGYTGRNNSASCIIIQMRDAATHELVASFEAEEYKYNNESEDIMKAIYKALDWFSYHIHPEIEKAIVTEGKKYIYMDLANYTSAEVNQVVMLLSYYKDGELVHEQEVDIKTHIVPGENERISIKRPKEFQSKDLKIQYKVISYK